MWTRSDALFDAVPSAFVESRNIGQVASCDANGVHIHVSVIFVCIRDGGGERIGQVVSLSLSLYRRIHE